MSRLTEMVRRDIEFARTKWILELKAEQRSNREQIEFLLSNQSDGSTVDFHASRHTCGAWLALAGIHPKQIQAVMRHSTIKLTLDTYGHLFPEQHTAAIKALAKALGS